MKILNFGSLNLDYVYTVDHIVIAGETQSSASMQIFGGGKGMNQSIALARAGAEVFHAGMIGEDGELLAGLCQDSGVRTELIRKIEGKSGHTIIQVDKNGQNCILLYGGANRCITKEFVDEVLEYFTKGDYLLLQNEISQIPYIIEKAAERGMVIVLNPSPWNALLEECDLSSVSMFILNEIEGWQITGEKEPEKILKKMARQYPNAKVVLTLGGDGAIYQDRDRRLAQPCFRVAVVDTTAAGDTFTGYFLAAVLENMPVQTGLELAAKAAAIAVSKKGAAPSIPVRWEVENLR